MIFEQTGRELQFGHKRGIESLRPKARPSAIDVGNHKERSKSESRLPTRETNKPCAQRLYSKEETTKGDFWQTLRDNRRMSYLPLQA